MFGAPHVLQLFTIINLTTAIGLALLALSLGLVWGYGGILCFGQTAFFGFGAYAYAIAAQNFGETTSAVAIAIVAGAALAAVLGYFMFYGRISDVYLGVITLTVTLIIFNLLRRTSGPRIQDRQSTARGIQRHHCAAAANSLGHKDDAVPTASFLCVHGLLCWSAISAASG